MKLEAITAKLQKVKGQLQDGAMRRINAYRCK
jgi:hypothetical protein